jgi:heat shock protein HslJ
MIKTILNLFSTSVPSLEGTQWKLVGWQQGTTQRSVLDGVELTVVFAEQRISGDSGCNQFTGSYRLQGNVVKVGELNMTARACLSVELMQQETDFLNAISGLKSVQTTENDQILFIYCTENGEEGTLRFKRHLA